MNKQIEQVHRAQAGDDKVSTSATMLKDLEHKQKELAKQIEQQIYDALEEDSFEDKLDELLRTADTQPEVKDESSDSIEEVSLPAKRGRKSAK